MNLFFDCLSLLFITGGALLSLSAALGLVRFRDTVSRMHASAKPQTLGLILTIAGVLVHIQVHADANASVRGDMGMLLLIAVFGLGTAPVVGTQLAGIARREHLVDREHLTRDDEN
ncbi:monovalent cation/H(+) antiporter subunit G [Corynebacterium sp. TAE3-ERU12]|uniref:monovalent cation/H(+) antiporter subunit G n=1 Tax=Corynebacterium sp. TAE3-ERU12 TaxID=2849491 RepID=UPI001C45BF97|nr:monovalent cation/H(+) antiporter subunit G [Corynebacterium sp. TAE3-ERU12]MBV7295960.1 monovalent cation/H(+) antiporter subunit G [Corynebacterium sp. TAE3-ERU12]